MHLRTGYWTAVQAGSPRGCLDILSVKIPLLRLKDHSYVFNDQTPAAVVPQHHLHDTVWIYHSNNSFQRSSDTYTSSALKESMLCIVSQAEQYMQSDDLTLPIL